MSINALHYGAAVKIDADRPWVRAFGRGAVLRNLRDPKEAADMRVDIALQGPRSRDVLEAIAGALAGAVVGDVGIPGDWLRGLRDWPRSQTVLSAVGARLAECSSTDRICSPVSYFWPGLVPRNLLFLVVVLLHGFRRLLPPY